MTKPADIKALRKNATDVSALMKLLSHPNRLLIACDLTEGEKSVSEIEADTGVPQPHVSRELARLRLAGLVVDRRQSKNVYYRIADQRLSTLIDALCDAFGGKHRAKARS
jgi:DNA-binding transcriptional ArsR family regulator